MYFLIFAEFSTPQLVAVSPENGGRYCQIRMAKYLAAVLKRRLFVAAAKNSQVASGLACQMAKWQRHVCAGVVQ